MSSRRSRLTVFPSLCLSSIHLNTFTSLISSSSPPLKEGIAPHPSSPDQFLLSTSHKRTACCQSASSTASDVGHQNLRASLPLISLLDLIQRLGMRFVWVCYNFLPSLRQTHGIFCSAALPVSSECRMLAYFFFTLCLAPFWFWIMGKTLRLARPQKGFTVLQQARGTQAQGSRNQSGSWGSAGSFLRQSSLIYLHVPPASIFMLLWGKCSPALREWTSLPKKRGK